MGIEKFTKLIHWNSLVFSKVSHFLLNARERDPKQRSPHTASTRFVRDKKSAIFDNVWAIRVSPPPNKEEGDYSLYKYSVTFESQSCR